MQCYPSPLTNPYGHIQHWLSCSSNSYPSGHLGFYLPKSALVANTNKAQARILKIFMMLQLFMIFYICYKYKPKLINYTINYQSDQQKYLILFIHSFFRPIPAIFLQQLSSKIMSMFAFVLNAVFKIVLLFLFLFSLQLFLLKFFLQVALCHKNLVLGDSQFLILLLHLFLMCSFMGFLPLINNIFHFRYIFRAFWFLNLTFIFIFISATLPLLVLVDIIILFYLSFNFIVYLIVQIN